jgi:beta-glucosidase
LLKNENDILPLKPNTKIYVEGFNKEEVKGYASLITSLENADVIVMKINTPKSKVDSKYYLEQLFGLGSLAFSPEEEAKLLQLIKSKPTITVANLQRPAVIPGINQHSKALIADFSSQDDIIMDLIFGKFKPTGKMPFELPSSMEAVNNQKEDLPYDSKDPLYHFGFGLGYK